MSDANRTLIRYKEETTFGTAPSGTYQVLRETGETLAPNLTYIQSQELRSDRQIGDLVLADIGAGGPINLEMSYGTYDDMLEALLQSADWTSPVTITASTIKANASDQSFEDNAAAGTMFANIVVGRWIKVSGFTGASTTANGMWKVITKPSSDKITVAGAALLIDDAQGESVTIYQGAQITNGTEQRSFTVEREYQDIASTFEKFVGMVVAQGALNVQAGAILTGSVTFLGKRGTSETASAASGDTAATTSEVLNAITNVEAIYENGVGPTSTLSAFSLGINVNNNLRTRPQIGSLGPISIGAGTAQITGTLQAYFSSAALFNRFLSNTPTSFAFILTDTALNRYVVDFPQIKFATGQRPGTAINTDVMADLTWQAYRDPSELITMRIQRFPAA